MFFCLYSGLETFEEGKNEKNICVYNYAQYLTNPMLHKAYCDRGDYILENHSFTVFSSIYAICEHCGYQQIISKSNGQ